jgi:hypothetical protein
MICQACQHDAAQIVHCDCFETFCRDCFSVHQCGREHLARFSSAPPDSETSNALEISHEPTELAEALLRLRPYQLECVERILEALA